MQDFKLVGWLAGRAEKVCRQRETVKARKSFYNIYKAGFIMHVIVTQLTTVISLPAVCH